jgi:hypothetical protein
VYRTGVEIAAQVQGDIDGEQFLASLPPRLRAVLELRLAGYSWDKAAQQLGVKASTLRGYLPELRAKFVEFFGYNPSNRASDMCIKMGVGLIIVKSWNPTNPALLETVEQFLTIGYPIPYGDHHAKTLRDRPDRRGIC